MRYNRTLPEGTVTCWVLNEEEKSTAIKEGKTFIPNGLPYLFFKFLKRIDSIFIEGNIGRLSDSAGGRLHDEIVRGTDYFDDFTSRKPVYFTFDGATLYQLMEIFPEKPLMLMLKRLDSLKPHIKNQAFMIMPFHNTKLDSFFTEHIQKYLKSRMGIEIYRADSFKTNDVVSETIYKMIEESEVVIADTTYENKNSFYELGYAARSGKEIITIQNRAEEQRLFFDRAHIRTLFYGMEHIDEFKFDLESNIKSIRSKT